MRASSPRLNRRERPVLETPSVFLCLAVLGCSSGGGEAPPYWQGGSSSGPVSPGGSLGGAKGEDDSETGGTSSVPNDRLALRAYDESFVLLPKDHASSGTIYLEQSTGTWDPLSYAGIPVAFTASEQAGWGAFVPSSTTQFLVTLSQVSGTAPALGVVPRLLIDTIFQQLIVPIEPDPSRAQVLVRVTDRSGTPLAQVVPEVPDARDIIYANLGSWLEASDQTSSEGMFLAADLPAATFPGSRSTVRLRGVVEGSFEVPVAAGGVTVFVVAFD